jgi:NAD(P)-dependent dehydrogenase (short-subunit alcohol dehydrogenase family)
MTTQALAANGAKVYIAGRTKEKLDSVVSKYGGSNLPSDSKGSIHAIAADISSKEGIQKLHDKITKQEDCVCILVNNAGISSKSIETDSGGDANAARKNLFESEDSNFEDWNATYNTNVSSCFFVTTAFLPLLRRSTEKHPGWSATVINITSISGQIMRSQHHFAYNASKAAAIHLTRMMAAELAQVDRLGIRVNSIAPGVFPSEMTAGESDEHQKSVLEKEKYEKVPAGRPGKDEDFAQAVLFAACNQYINGITVTVDGGYTLHAGM